MHHFIQRIPGDLIRKELSDVETLTEERIEVVIRRFLHDLKENALEGNGWPFDGACLWHVQGHPQCLH